MNRIAILLLTIITVVSGEDLTIPKKFLIGASTSSYQIEGAWNVSGKSENLWDYLTHNSVGIIADNSSGDVACDSYHKYKEDAEIVKDIGFDHYRFSISWARILPSGHADKINVEGVRHYHKVLDELDKHGIIPFVTLYHWDHPQSLTYEFRGWLDERMAYAFAEYARVVFKEFGHRVKFFSTINEPYMFCTKAYRSALTFSNTNTSGWGEYECVHNILKAHALAYHIYDKEFRNEYNGQVGIVLSSAYSYGDKKSMDIAFEFELGWQANPIFSKNGDYPNVMRQRIDERSRLQGFNESRLPVLSKYWIEYIKGTFDYLGLNHYSSNVVKQLHYSTILDWPIDHGLETIKILSVHPQGFGDLLRKIKDKYNNPPIYVLENGVSDEGNIEDTSRVEYLYSYMKEMLKAVKEDGCNVKAYSVWSLLDNFEWFNGYTKHFGLVQVDFDDVNRKRTMKKSAKWIKAVLTKRKLLPPNY